jgi:hypothetical protein
MTSADWPQPRTRQCAAAVPTVLNGWASDGQKQREPTKLECGLLGALLASIALAFLFCLGIQLSVLTLVIP